MSITKSDYTKDLTIKKDMELTIKGDDLQRLSYKKEMEGTMELWPDGTKNPAFEKMSNLYTLDGHSFITMDSNLIKAIADSDLGELVVRTVAFTIKGTEIKGWSFRLVTFRTIRQITKGLINQNILKQTTAKDFFLGVDVYKELGLVQPTVQQVADARERQALEEA